MKLEKKFLKKLIKKDRRSQNIFYQNSFSFLMNIAMRYKKNEDDAAMLVNQAFMKILSNINRYNADMNIEPWLKQIMVNTAIDDFRKNAKYHQLTQPIDEEVHEAITSVHNNIIDKINADELQSMLNKLPQATCHVFNLFAIDGFSHKEIGEMLGISVETSKWHVKEARSRLKKLYYTGQNFELKSRKAN